jgi:hypothetical protein
LLLSVEPKIPPSTAFALNFNATTLRNVSYNKLDCDSYSQLVFFKQYFTQK